MLPILRIVPVGGVFLAILILILALTPPDGTRAPFAQRLAVARGPLLDRDEHPEWRQLLIRAAVQRADALNRLRELPDTPTRTASAIAATPETPPAPEAETQAAAEPKIAPKKPSETSTPAPSEPPGSERAARTEAEPTNASPAMRQPAAPDPVPPATEESATAEIPTAAPPAPVQAAPPESARPEEAAKFQPPPPAAPASVADVPKQPPELPSDRRQSDSTPDEATGSIDAMPDAPAATAARASSTPELTVVLPEKRPAAADAPQPARHSRRPRTRKAQAEQPKKPMTFFDLLFGNVASNAPPAPSTQPGTQPIQRGVQPNAPKQAATSGVTVFRDFGASMN